MASLIDPYGVYQHLMDYWAEAMQDDAWMIASDGWQALQGGKPNNDLIPATLIVSRTFAQDQAVIAQLEAARDAITRQMEELIEEHDSEGGLLELPALDFRSLQGETVPLIAFKGKPTVVNLWATWCPPCVREMPVLQQAQVDRPGVNFVFLNQGESPAKVDAWLQARNMVLDNVLLDEARTAGAAFKQSALPMTLFFDADGQLITTRVGELSQATLAERLAARSSPK